MGIVLLLGAKDGTFVLWPVQNLLFKIPSNIIKHWLVEKRWNIVPPFLIVDIHVPAMASSLHWFSSNPWLHLSGLTFFDSWDPWDAEIFRGGLFVPDECAFHKGRLQNAASAAVENGRKSQCTSQVLIFAGKWLIWFPKRAKSTCCLKDQSVGRHQKF